MQRITCPTPADFRVWLERHHADTAEVEILLFKTGSGKPSITWPQSIDEALCFGWIDGVRQPIDPDSYTVRFTPRRRGSRWSQVNIAKVAELRAQGRMTPAGEAAFESRVEGPPRAYSPKAPLAEFDPDHARSLAENTEAGRFWAAQAPSWRHKMTWWVTSAKQTSTRDARMTRLVEACAAGRRLM